MIISKKQRVRRRQLRRLQSNKNVNKQGNTQMDEVVPYLLQCYSYHMMDEMLGLIEDIAISVDAFGETASIHRSLQSMTKQIASIVVDEVIEDESIEWMKERFTALLQEQLVQLQPAALRYSYQLDTGDPALDSLVKQISIEVKDGTKITIALFEQFEEIMSTREDEQSIEALQQLYKCKSSYIRLLIKGVDSIDLITKALAASESTKDEWTKQVEMLIDELLAKLADVGIVEYPVRGKLLDGSYMESIGMVAATEDLPAYSVVDVFERCFLEEKSNDVIRYAKVINIG